MGKIKCILGTREWWAYCFLSDFNVSGEDAYLAHCHCKYTQMHTQYGLSRVRYAALVNTIHSDRPVPVRKSSSPGKKGWSNQGIVLPVNVHCAHAVCPQYTSLSYYSSVHPYMCVRIYSNDLKAVCGCVCKRRTVCQLGTATLFTINQPCHPLLPGKWM